MTPNPVHILLVDDDDVDVMTVQRAFQKAKIANPVHIARDGVEALALIRGGNGTPPLPRPYMILLDLNMPRMSGIELLQELRADPEHRSAVVFMMTTSKDDRDRMAAYNLNVAGYILKSEAGEDFRRVVDMLEQYWLIVHLP